MKMYMASIPLKNDAFQGPFAKTKCKAWTDTDALGCITGSKEREITLLITINLHIWS